MVEEVGAFEQLVIECRRDQDIIAGLDRALQGGPFDGLQYLSQRLPIGIAEYHELTGHRQFSQPPAIALG